VSKRPYCAPSLNVEVADLPPFRITLALLCCLVAASVPAIGGAAERLQTPHVELRLLAGQAGYVPGQTLWVGLRFDLEPEWHVYWRNPGDSGEPPRVAWRLPPGWQAGDIHWPVPQRIPVGHLVNYGYEDSVTFLVPLTAATAAAGDARIAADVDWLVCREECIPESGSLELRLPAAAEATSDPAVAAHFDRVRGRWPVALDADAVYRTDGARLQLSVATPGWQPDRIDDAWFAAFDWGPVAPSAEQTWSLDDGRLYLDIGPGDMPLAAGQALAGLLVVTEAGDDGPLTRGFTLDAVAATPTVDAANTTAGTTLAMAALLAFTGGLLLNLMPCVLPVLSIKAMSLVGHGAHAGARHAAAFALGVLATFTVLAAALIGLRGAGAAVGWGFQLQEPAVVLLLMYLMLVIALNLSGVFSLGGRLMGIGQSASARPDLRGSFATGVLAVVVASPCTAPFMAGALGFAATQPAGVAFAVFLALGAGFALPLVLLTLWPGWRRFLPPPGAWMERLRNLLAFPMYGAAAWLLWVLSQQVDAAVLGAALTGAVLLAFALWWLGQPLQRPRRQRLVAAASGGAGLALAFAATFTGDDRGTSTPTAERWSADKVAALRAEGRAVLVNFTAAWCITCKVNEQVALDTEAVRAALAQRNVAYLKGDWTSRDATIAAELNRHGRDGVPLYLLYPPGQGQPRVLPQLLTEGLVRRAIDDL
jgi:thiol:disulfide interchange protein DsbD